MYLLLFFRVCLGTQFPSPLPKPSRHSPPASPLKEESFYITAGGQSDTKPASFNKGNNRQSSTSSSGLRLSQRSSGGSIKEDTTYGAEMLRLHRSLHATNTKLIGTLSSPNPPPNPFTATFGYAGELSTASIVPVFNTNAARGISRRQDSSDDLTSKTRDKDKNGSNSVETALAMGRMVKRLDKLGEVDEVVNQVCTRGYWMML